MPSHKLPNVSSAYGAPMGRGSVHAPLTAPKLRMNRVRVDAGGYDSGGAYWGRGEALYHVESDDGEIEYFVRAPNRERAKREVREKYTEARFYR